jgi:D-arabinose 1-dehydrogenase-like Zn-dependent alcohol dehydrogenase
MPMKGQGDEPHDARMVLERPGTGLRLVHCAVPDPVLPMIPGHEIVGRVAALGAGVPGWQACQRVGVPWLGWTCGRCRFCRAAHGHAGL